MTAALEGGERSAARFGRILPPGKTRYPFYRRLIQYLLPNKNIAQLVDNKYYVCILITLYISAFLFTVVAGIFITS